MIALNIEDTNIKMAVVEGKRVVKAASLPLTPGLIKDGLIQDKATVGRLISELLAAYDVADKQVAVNVSGMHSLYRVFSLPRLPKGMLDEAVRRQMSKVIPVPLREIHTSWQALDVSSTETVICLVGSPRNTVDALWETLRLAGLQPQFIDVNPLALARLSDEKDAMVVYVQPAGFDIVVMADGIPRLVRSLSFAAEDVEASDRVQAVKDEVDRTMSFYQSSQTGDVRLGIPSVFLSGESRQALANVLDYPIKQLPEWFSYPEGFDSSEYAVNIGLALREVRAARSPARVSLNVVPEIYRPKPRSMVGVFSWVVILVAIAIFVPLLIFTSREVTKTATLQTQVNAAQSRVDAIQSTMAELQRLQANVDKETDALDIFRQPLETFDAQRTKINGDLAEVTSLQPGALTLTSINYAQGGSITVSGTSPDKSLILAYGSALRDTGRFSYVAVRTMTELEFNKWGFTVELR